MASFEGKTAIVTGAARGIGRAVAQKLIEQGARVMLADSDETRLQTALEAISAPADQAQHFTSDTSQKFGVNNLIAATIGAFDQIDVLVTTPKEFERSDLLSLPVEALDSVMAGNLRSAFLLSQTVANKMIAASEKLGEERLQSGAIVHISALSGQISSPEIAAQAISCAALDQLTRSLAATLAPHGIRVNGVAPGGVMTETLRGSIQNDPGLRTALIARTPLGRIGEPSEAAQAALYLASEASSFITGQILTVDGGRSVLDPLAAANI